MVRARIRMVLPPNKQLEAIKILMSVAESTKIDRGCICCWIYRDVTDKRVIMFEESWERQKDPDRHLRSDDYLKMLLVIEMSVEAPEILFDTNVHSTGISTIEKARKNIR
jgi:quinol monooxygenase YgiN